MVSTTRLARISGLLDEAKETLECTDTRQISGVIERESRAWKKIDEAQRLLLTDERESDPRDN